MTRPASRERRERFILSFDSSPAVPRFMEALRDCIRRGGGLSWFTDEQIEQIAARLANDARWTTRLNVRNRRSAAAAITAIRADLAEMGAV